LKEGVTYVPATVNNVPTFVPATVNYAHRKRRQVESSMTQSVSKKTTKRVLRALYGSGVLRPATSALHAA